MEILTDYTEETLTKVIHDSWNSLIYKFMGNNPNTLYKETSELKTIDKNIKVPMFNRIYNTNLLPENTEQKLPQNAPRTDEPRGGNLQRRGR